MKFHTLCIEPMAVMMLLAAASPVAAGGSLDAAPLDLAQADEGGRGPRRGPPPQEAFDACVSKEQGDACVVSIEDSEIDGVCRQPPRGRDGAMICVPAGQGDDEAGASSYSPRQG